MAKEAARISAKTDVSAETPELPRCGIVRPIADMEPYPSGHWAEVHEILAAAVSDAGYEARLVSENESVGVILGNIVANLYSDPIVICDVSGKNPNVMFELGMRIAFEKPTIIVTDDITPFSFDISPIKHLIYPASLRFKGINRFKADVSAAIVATVETAQDKNYRGYLQQFGPIEVAELGTQLVSAERIVQDLQEIRRSIRALETRRPAPATRQQADIGVRQHYVSVNRLEADEQEKIIEELGSLESVAAARVVTAADSVYVELTPAANFNRDDVVSAAAPIKKRYNVS